MFVPLFVSFSVCLYLCMSLSLYVCTSVCLFLCMFVPLFVSFCMFAPLYVSLFVSLSLSLSICLFTLLLFSAQTLFLFSSFIEIQLMNIYFSLPLSNSACLSVCPSPCLCVLCVFTLFHTLLHINSFALSRGVITVCSLFLCLCSLSLYLCLCVFSLSVCL
jgi:hypothetical protein